MGCSNSKVETNDKRDKKEKGIIKYENGEIKYDGDWNNDLQDGNGKFVEKEGNYYIGEFKNGLKHGKEKNIKNLEI